MLTPVPPVQPAAPWLGDKRTLARRICAILDATPCTPCAEPFVGMGGICLRRCARPRAEVINDRGRETANLFRILQRHCVQCLEVLRFAAVHLTEVRTTYSIDRTRASSTGDRADLLISNRPLPVSIQLQVSRPPLPAPRAMSGCHINRLRRTCCGLPSLQAASHGPMTSHGRELPRPGLPFLFQPAP